MKRVGDKIQNQRSKVKHQASKRCFSLIEVSIAVLILALISGGMLEIFFQGFNAAKKSMERTTAYSLARGIIEEYSDWDTLDKLDGTYDGTVTNGVYTNPPNQVSLSGVSYTPTLTVADGPIHPDKLKQLTVTVSWGTESYTLTTLKADY